MVEPSHPKILAIYRPPGPVCITYFSSSFPPQARQDNADLQDPRDQHHHGKYCTHTFTMTVATRYFYWCCYWWHDQVTDGVTESLLSTTCVTCLTCLTDRLLIACWSLVDLPTGWVWTVHRVQTVDERQWRLQQHQPRGKWLPLIASTASIALIDTWSAYLGIAYSYFPALRDRRGGQCHGFPGE